jgi:hypothetical protein
MAWFDVLIPALIGLVLITSPRVFSKPTGDAEKDAATRRHLRNIGLGLFAVAGIYLLVKLGQLASAPAP